MSEIYKNNVLQTCARKLQLIGRCLKTGVSRSKPLCLLSCSGKYSGGQSDRIHQLAAAEQHRTLSIRYPVIRDPDLDNGQPAHSSMPRLQLDQHHRRQARPPATGWLQFRSGPRRPWTVDRNPDKQWTDTRQGMLEIRRPCVGRPAARR